jgi:hypothetical protein
MWQYDLIFRFIITVKNKHDVYDESAEYLVVVEGSIDILITQADYCVCL